MHQVEPHTGPQVSWRDLVALVAMIVIGAAVRIYFRDLPNFAPVAAMSLFAGFYFRSVLMASIVPVSVMLISDCFIGFYDARVMAIVYAMLLFPVFLRAPLRRYLSPKQGQVRDVVAPVAGLVGCSLLSSVLFFLTTNFASWLFFNGYEKSVWGLMECYVAAIPFFRHTLTGDLMFGFILFGSYGLALNRGWSVRPTPATTS